WLNKATLPENANEKSFKLQSKDVKINPVQVVNVDLVVTESGGTYSDKHDTSSSSGNYLN
ncbi:hypothetical protein Tco_0521701, partial [Tanacetum coccineum]